MDAIIHLRRVAKRYRSSRTFLPVLQDFDLEVEHGQFVAITGPSGAGKTTVLNLIGGLDRPDAGSITVDGTRLDALTPRALTLWRGRHIGFVFQAHHLLPMLTAAANVELPLLLTPLTRRRRRDRVAQAMARVGLSDRSDHRPGQLSGGEQQRVGIARAIVASAPILLCDEPTAGLDRAAADSILRLLCELNADGHAIVMVTHDPHAATLAHRRVELTQT